MTDQNRQLEPSVFFHEFMIQQYQNSLELTRRSGDRSEKAIQQFITLISALASVIAVVFLSDTSTPIKTVVALIGFVTTCIFGTLTYVWVLKAVFEVKDENVVRLHGQRYFRDLDPNSYRKYGRTLVLDTYTTNLQNADGVISISLLALIIFNGFTAGTAASIVTYLNSDVFLSTENALLSVIVGLIWFVLLGVAWGRRFRSHRKLQHKSQGILDEFEHEIAEIVNRASSKREQGSSG